MADGLSRQYVDTALEELIVALGDPLTQCNEDFLVTVSTQIPLRRLSLPFSSFCATVDQQHQFILLHLHEETSEADDQCYHLGSARVLNSICSFATDGGLREVVSWISLRQHLTVLLVKQQPLGLHLSDYHFSKAFDLAPQDNELWTNRIIYVVAKTL